MEGPLIHQSGNGMPAGLSNDRTQVEIELARFPHKVKEAKLPKSGGNDEPFNNTAVNVQAAWRGLGMPEKRTSPKKANVLNVAQPAFQGKRIPKDEAVGLGPVRDADLEGDSPAFTIDELKKVSTGDYNVGELKLKSNGKLDKVNNHVHGLSWMNKVKLTPEQNLAVRRQVCKCFMGEYAENPRINAVKELLLNERDRTSSLSRDEVKFLFNMLDGAVGQGEFTVANFKKLHDFKVGKLTDATDVKPFVTGLASKYEDEVGVHDIATAVSVNAQQGIVSIVIDEALKFIRSLFTGNEYNSRALDVKLDYHGGTNYSNGLDDGEKIKRADVEQIVQDLKDHYRLPKNILLAKNTVGTEDFAKACKKDIYTELQKKIGKKMLEARMDKNMAENKEKLANFIKWHRLSPRQKEELKNLDFEAIAKQLKDLDLPPDEAKMIKIEQIRMEQGGSAHIVFRYNLASGANSGGDGIYQRALDANGKWTTRRYNRWG